MHTYYKRYTVLSKVPLFCPSSTTVKRGREGSLYTKKKTKSVKRETTLFHLFFAPLSDHVMLKSFPDISSNAGILKIKVPFELINIQSCSSFKISRRKRISISGFLECFFSFRISLLWIIKHWDCVPLLIFHWPVSSASIRSILRIDMHGKCLLAAFKIRHHHLVDSL